MTVRVKDNGANARVRAAKSLKEGPHVRVGVIGADGSKGYADGGDVTVLDVATWAEFGIGQPRRSWLRDWIELNKDEVRERLKIETRAVMAGKRTRDQALARIGVWIVGQIQKRIADGIAPANAPSTIEKKGSDTPLIDTGQFRSSITSKVVK